MFYGWWLVLVGLIVQAVGGGLVVFAYGVIVLPIEREFGATRLAMMLGISCCNLVSGLCSPWLGSLVDRRPMRLLMAAGAATLAVGFCVLSYSTAVWHVVVCYALFMSIAQVLLGPLTASTLIARWFSTRRGLALGIVSVGPSVGGFVFPPLLQYLIAEYDWRVACRVLAILTLALTVPPAWLLVANHPADKGLRPDGAGELRQPEADPTSSPSAPLTSTAVLRHADFWFIAVVVGTMFATTTALLTNLVPYAVGRGLSAAEAAGLLSVVAITSCLGNVLFGAVADRVDLRWAMAASLVFVCVALGIFRIGQSTALLWSASAILGLSSGGVLPVWSAMLGKVFGVINYGRVMGLMNPVLSPLVLISSPLAGRIFDLTGDYRLVFETFLVGLLLVSVALTRLRPMAPHAQ